MNCAKPLDPTDKFCSTCGQKVIQRPDEIERTTSDTSKSSFEKQAEHYSRMSNGDLTRLSAELTDLTETARAALLREITKRGLKESPLLPETPSHTSSQSGDSQTGESISRNYEKMSDEELQQLSAAYQKLQQQVPDSLRSELAARASRQVQTAPIPSSTPTQNIATTQLTADAQPTAETTLASVSVSTKSPPYAKFVILIFLACLFASAGVFAFFDASARNSTAIRIEILSGALTLIFAWFSWTAYKVIPDSESKSDPKYKHRSRKALVTSLILIVLYLGLAALLGSVIGQNRTEAVRLNSDISHQKELAGRITEARNGVSNSIQSYLDMYARIESDVNDYSSTLLRLRQEISIYNSKFPEQAASMQKYSNTIEREIRRSSLLQKQIASAKRIGSLDVDQQVAVWRSEMTPILEEEDALDKSK